MVESTSNDMLDDRKYYDIQGYHSWSTYKYRVKHLTYLSVF